MPAGVLLSEVEEVDAVVVSEAVDVASVVVAIKAETIPVLNVPIMRRLIRRTLAAENATTLIFISTTYLIKSLSVTLILKITKYKFQQ